MNPNPTSARAFGIWPLAIALVLAVTACGGIAPVVEGSGEPQAADGGEELDNDSADSDVEVRLEDSSGDEEQAGDPESESATDIDVLTSTMEGDPAPPDFPAEGSDLTLGGAPDTSTAAAIRAGLEEAGMVLDGITLSVLPVSGTGTSLLVIEASDEYLETSLAEDDDGTDMSGVLLDLPAVENASISALVTIYRGSDEQGPFTMTFAVSMSDLREAHQAGTDLEDDQLVVQLRRGP